MSLLVTAAEVSTSDGTLVATIARIPVGGGVQVVTVDGVPEDRVHVSGAVYHVRCLSPDPMLPDILLSVADYAAAAETAEAYAVKRAEHAAELAALAQKLAV